MSDSQPTNPLSRRKLIAALSASAGVAAAGCLGDDDDEEADENLGEPVEEVIVDTMTGLPAASEQEDVGLHIQETLQELGMDTTGGLKELVTIQDDIASDAREHHIHIDTEPPFHEFLDPYEQLQAMTAEKAGNNSFIQNNQYASCEYSEAVIELATATEDEQQELVNEALSIASADVERINFVNTVSQSAYRTDQIEVERVAVGGINDRSYEAFWDAELLEGNDIIMNIAPGNIPDVAYHSSHYSAGWTNFPLSPLTFYDLDNELTGGIATDWEWSDEATTLTMDIREDATFHEGEDILAEDVQWNYEWFNENAGVFGIQSFPYEDIEVEDDKRIAFHFTQPTLHFLHFTHLFGIVEPGQWIDAGAEEEPVSPDIDAEDLNGSGPYVIESFDPETLLDMSPFEDHFGSPTSNFVFQGFADVEGARRAFSQGEINVLQNATQADIDVIDDDIPDVSETYAREDTADWFVAMQTNFGPTKFHEFRLALSHALDRDLMHETLQYGESSSVLYSSVLPEMNPSYPDDPDEVLTQVADDTAPDIEQAREILEEEGWGWDGDGNLHYPQDVDRDPLWPEGDDPNDHPDEFPCVEDLPP